MKYLIKDTTMEERMELVQKALTISLTGADKPTDEMMELINQYIDGIMELDEIQKIILEKYQKKGEI